MQGMMEKVFGSMQARDAVAHFRAHNNTLSDRSHSIGAALGGTSIQDVAKTLRVMGDTWYDWLERVDLTVHDHHHHTQTLVRGASSSSSSSSSVPKKNNNDKVKPALVLKYPVLLAAFSACLPPEWMWILDALTTYEWFELGTALFRDTPLEKITPAGAGVPCVPFWLMRPEDIKVLVLGAWPYTRDKECVGYAMSSTYVTETLRDLRNAVSQDFDVPPTRSEDELADLGPWALAGVMCLNTTWVSANSRDGGEQTHPLWLKLTRAVVQGVHERVGAQCPLAIVPLGRDANAVITPEMEAAFEETYEQVPRQVFRRNWLNRTGSIANTMLFMNINVFRVWHDHEPIPFANIL